MVRSGQLKSGMAGLALALTVSACSGASEAPAQTQAQGDALRTAEITRGKIARIINASGAVKPETTVQVGSEVSGRILSLGADFNSIVKEGDVLAIIDPEVFENRVLQARASLSNAQAQIRIREAAVQRARITLNQAVVEEQRITNLFKSNAASQARLEGVKRDLGVAKSDLDLALAQLDGAQSSLKQSEAALRTAQVDLARTVIRSPIDGIVIERKVDAGQTVQASFSAPELFLIANDLSSVQVEASIVESDVAGLGQGDAVTFTVDAYPTNPFQGTVDLLRLNSKEVSNIVTYTAVVSASNPDGYLMPGMTANLQIITDSKDDVLRLPAAAERFRPTPDVVAKWQSDEAVEGDAKLEDWVTITGYLRQMQIPAARIETIKTQLNAATEKIREDLANPELGWRRTPNLKRLSEQSRIVVEEALSPTELQAYRQLEQEASAVRNADIWVATGDGKMTKRSVGLGVSDGAFVEVFSGLEAGDKVVLGIGGAGGQRGGPPGRRGGPRG